MGACIIRLDLRSEIDISGCKIGDGHPLFIISEYGVTCNQSVELAQSLVDATADAGADAIKFTFCFPEEYMNLFVGRTVKRNLKKTNLWHEKMCKGVKLTYCYETPRHNSGPRRLKASAA